MVGFGDPIFRPEQLADASPRTSSNKVAARTRAYTNFWQGKGVDRARLSEALPALPDTAKELKAVAKEVGALAADIHLGKDASETTVKGTPLAVYRIVYFATHGLVAGDVKGLGEPGAVGLHVRVVAARARLPDEAGSQAIPQSAQQAGAASR